MDVKRTLVCRGILLNLLLGCLPVMLWAGNEMGGQLSMQAIDNVPGRFRSQVTSYIDNTTLASNEQNVIAGISRKRDNLLVYTFNVYEMGEGEN
jgi:hypothetical protein